jgi:hypothetical protein
MGKCENKNIYETLGDKMPIFFDVLYGIGSYI